MLLVILGAGASHDSIDGEDAAAPPLTDGLFEPRFFGYLNKFKGSSAAANRVIRGIEQGGSLEGELQKLRDEAEGGYDPLKAQLLAIQFFLQDVTTDVSSNWGERLGGMNNYATLVGAIEEWRHEAKSRVLYVTFNYDTLLEQALERELGKSFESVERYLDQERAVVKVHGSCNWKREISGLPPPDGIGEYGYDRLIKLAPQLRYSDRYHVIAKTTQVVLGSSLIAPAVAIPIVNKSGPEEFACPPSHLARMREWMGAVTDVLVVGWKGNEAHFVSEVNDHVPHGVRISIVGSPLKLFERKMDPPPDTVQQCAAVPIRWVQSAGLKGPCKVYRTGFSGYLREHLPTWLSGLTPEPS